MASVNKVILVGYLGGDPEVRYTPSGKAFARFSLATNEAWTDGEGKRQERVEWHTLVVWGKQAENCRQYLTKGRQIYVDGSLRSRSYEDKDGIKRAIVEIITQRVVFLSGGNGARAVQDGENQASTDDELGVGPTPDDGIPF